jgi:hypothetical protein
MRTIGVILCSATKKNYKCDVREMYNDSTSFRARRIFMDYVYDEWYVNTSKYGFMTPDFVAEPYDSFYIKYSTTKKANVLTDEMINDWLVRVQNQFPDINDIKLHCHLSLDYYNKLKIIFPNIKWIPQQKVLNKTAWRYHDATMLLINGGTLKQAFDLLGEKNTKPSRHEEPKWFYHYDGTEVFGLSTHISQQYQVNDFNIWSVSMGDSNMTCGWVVDKTLLPHVNKLPSGSYRMDKGYSKKNPNMERGDIKLHLDKLETLIKNI